MYVNLLAKTKPDSTDNQWDYYKKLLANSHVFERRAKIQ